MIVKILKKSATFKGVRYNTRKMDSGKGELMLAANFGALQSLTDLRPEDYIHYLEAFSARSIRTEFPQFHVVISANGREKSKEELTVLAADWLREMGYGANPYLLIFHRDTKNNHIHLVTTRVGPDGKKINDRYEKIRAYQVLNRLLGVNESLDAGQDINQALRYRFSTRAQFLMLLEAKGYALSLDGAAYRVAKFGKNQGNIPVARIDRRIAEYQADKERLAQLRMIIAKYRQLYGPELVAQRSPLPGSGEGRITGYSSELAEMLREKFGLQVLFHYKDDKPPYGYTVIDHARQTVYKGGLLMPLAELIRASSGGYVTADQGMPEFIPQETALETSAGYAGLFDADDPGLVFQEGPVPPLRLDIADDIDDEQIHGRNRRRKRKTRTNSR